MTRVLVIDDDPEVRAVLRLGLEAYGYAVDGAASGELVEAVRGRSNGDEGWSRPPADAQRSAAGDSVETQFRKRG